MLHELLEKLGIPGYDGLTKAEKETYEQWATTLQTADATIDDLKRFFAAETDRANAELRKYENTPRQQLFYQMYATFLTNAKAFIFAPTQQREELRARLKKDFHIDI